MNEKQAGGDILGRLAGLISRPFVGAAKSQAVNNSVVNGITNYVNKPIEAGLRRGGVHKLISKAYEYGTTPIPGTPKFVQPVMPHPEQRRAYGNWKADNIVHTISNNPELLAGAAVPIPGTTEAILGTKHLLGRVLGVKKLASFIPSFANELEKTAEVSAYQQETQWTCSAACLKAVANHYGLPLDEETAVQSIGTRPNRGAECNEIAEAARALGFLAFEYSFESIDQANVLLEQDIPIICDIQSFNNPGKGHYVVMVAVSHQHVKLMDPNTPGNWRIISKQEMEARWWDRAMAPPHEMMPKWGIVIVPSEESADEGQAQ